MSGLARFPTDPDWDWLRREYRDAVLLQNDCLFGLVTRLCRGRMAYLATPYSREVVDESGNWDAARSSGWNSVTANWVRLFALHGVTVVSPIVQACAMIEADVNDTIDPLDDDFWSSWCAPILEASGVVIVPPMRGWERSKGIWREVCHALGRGMLVFLVSSDTRWVGDHVCL
jgi:Domain of unknown function (DUF1937)